MSDISDNAFPLPGVSTVTTIADWENLFSPGLTSGVITPTGSGLAGSLDTIGRNAVIGSGAAILRGFYKPVSVPTATPIPAPNTQNRIDRLVLRLDRSAAVAANFVVPVVITGNPGTSPQPPALQQTTTTLWDLPVCSWTTQSSGGLAALKDERYFISAVHSGLSAARPLLTEPGLLIEKDTGRIALWTGVLWTYITPAADTWNTMAGHGGANWDASGASFQRFTLGGLDGVAFRGSVVTPPAGTYNSVTAVSLPAPYPALVTASRRWPVTAPTSTTIAYGILNIDGTISFNDLPGGYNGSPVEINGTVWF